MKKLIISTLIASSSLLASNIAIDSLGVNLGVSNTNYKQTNNQGRIILGNEPDKSFSNIEIFTILNNLFTNDTIKPYVSYTYSSNSDLKHQYLLSGINKYYKHSQVIYYAGVVAGYGELKWKYDPLNSSSSSDHKATSFIVGLQGGLEYPISKQYSLNLNTKYLVHDYETELKPSNTVSSSIEHDRTASISVGIKYSF